MWVKITAKIFSKTESSYYLANKQAGMAKLTGAIKFTGRIDELSAYYMKGTEGVVLRRKGGPSVRAIKTHPHFELVRRNNKEWGGAALAMRQVIAAVQPIKHLKGHANYTGKLQKVCTRICKLDNDHPIGERHFLFSRYGKMLEGFSVNLDNTFDTVLSHPLQYSLDAVAGSAIVAMPDILPGINLYNPLKQPLYRIIISLGVMTDLQYDTIVKEYRPALTHSYCVQEISTPWFGWGKRAAPGILQLNIPNWQPETGPSLVLAAGIEFGTAKSPGEIQYMKYAGAGKVLVVG